MNDQEVDSSLFPSGGASPEEQEAIWSGAAEAAAKANPIGTFQGEILSAEYGPSNSSGRMQIHYEIKILVGESKDTVVHKYDGLGSAKQAAITQGQLKRLGIDTSKITVKTLPAHLLQLKGMKVQFQGKQNGEFYNIFFQKTLAQAVGGDATRPTAAAGASKRPTSKKF